MKDQAVRINEQFNLLLSEFDTYRNSDELRTKVLALAKMLEPLTNLGIVTVDPKFNKSNRDRILAYFQQYVGEVITREELFVVSGGWECTRRTRELRFQYGWPIISRDIIAELIDGGELPAELFSSLTPASYLMLENKQDEKAAYRYNVIKDIKKREKSGKKRLLEFFKEFVNIPLNGEELADLAGKTEWARRVRELRTEQGWPIMTNKSGRPDLPQGYYVLVEDKQEEVHDRTIPLQEKVTALDRDGNRCRKCNWSPVDNPHDPIRHQLELHHIRHHVNKGANVAANLVTLCNLHHDQIHKLDKNNSWSKQEVMAWLSE
ncbi:MAG: HNH endonuclease signature motif containing protein [Saprospiraceae bacterium]